MAIADTEPTTLTVGDTVQWNKQQPDYPATDGWTLHYAFQGPSQIVIDATASGATHVISVSATTTAAWTAGAYLWTSYVTNGAGARHTIESGQVALLPNPAATAPTTHASRTLALIQSAMEGRIPNGLEHTNIDGQELSRIPLLDLQKLESIYLTKVASEANRAAMAAGLGNRRNIFARFTPVR